MNRHKERPIPEALYSCSDRGCAEEVSFPAPMLRWYKDGWYCDNGLDERLVTLDEPGDAMLGPTLAEELRWREA